MEILTNIRRLSNLVRYCYENPFILQDIDVAWIPSAHYNYVEIIRHMQSICHNDIHSVTKEELLCAMEMNGVQDADVIASAYEYIINEKKLSTIERSEVIGFIKNLKIKDAYMAAIESYSNIKNSCDPAVFDEHLASVRDMFTVCDMHIESHRVNIDDAKDISIDTAEYISEKYGLLNKGYEKKTLSIYIGPSNSGKSIFLCNEAAFHLMNGLNVLFITLEMSANSVAKRINQNRFGLNEEQYYEIVNDKDAYTRLTEEYKKQYPNGTLEIVELPTGEAGAEDIEFEIKAFEAKYGKLDVLIVDYMQIMKSKGQQLGNRNASMYDNGKQISTALRALAMEYNLAVISAAQTNRDGLYGNNKGQSVIAESAAIYHTCDNVFLIQIDGTNSSVGSLTADKVRDSSTKDSIIGVLIDYKTMTVTKKPDENTLSISTLKELETSNDAVDENGADLFGDIDNEGVKFTDSFINGLNL